MNSLQAISNGNAGIKSSNSRMRMGLGLVLAIAMSPVAILHAQSDAGRELKQLREQRDKAIEPINRRYQQSLEQLFRRATQTNDLDTAIKIKAELAALKTKAGRLPDGYLGAWVMKVGSGSFPRMLKPNGVLVTQDGTFEWKVEDDKLMLKSTGPNWDTFDLPGREDRLEGRIPDGTSAILVRQ